MIYNYDLEKAINKKHTALKAYIIEGDFHLIWRHWMVSIVHLREVEGVETAKKQFPTATHEILIQAIGGCETNQFAKLTLENETVISLEGQPLMPPDLAKQIGPFNDEKALEIFEKFVPLIQSPDSDYRTMNTNTINTTIKNEL